MPYDAPPDLAGLSLAEIADLAGKPKLPPVESWNPEVSGDSGMRIAADGTWYHDGSPIRRAAMVRAFSSILRRDADGGYWLVTPYEKQSITVEDVPFLAVEMEARGEGRDRRLAFRLNTDDLVIAGADHALRFADMDSEPRPYLAVRGGMEARIARPVFYRLVDMAEENEDGTLGLWSGGAFFPLMSAGAAS